MRTLTTTGHSDALARRWTPRAVALLTAALIGGSLMPAASGGAQAAPQIPGPAPGVTMSAASGVVTSAGPPVPTYLAYTGTDAGVYVRTITTPAAPPIALGGRLIGGPGATVTTPGTVAPEPELALFGRGTDSAVWWRHHTATGWTGWQSLGGQVASSPAATVSMTGQFGALNVFAAGPGGGIWYRVWTRGGWRPWTTLGGERALRGTGPGGGSDAAFALAGIEQHVWMYGGTSDGFVDYGGRTTASPGTALMGTNGGISSAFARGTDNALWYRASVVPPPLAPSGPWRSLGGRLTSGVTATTGTHGNTYVFVLGTDNRIWMRAGVLPNLGGWTRL